MVETSAGVRRPSSLEAQRSPRSRDLDSNTDGSEFEDTFLKRVLRTVHSENRPSFEVEGDPRHAEKLCERPWTCV